MITPAKPKMSDLYNGFSNAGGGFGSPADPFTSLLKGLFAPAPAGTFGPAPTQSFPSAPNMSTNKGPVVAPPPTLSQVAAGAPARPILPPVAPSGPSKAPVGPQGATGAASASQTPIPRQYLNADGSIKTPDQVAADIAGSVKGAAGAGDAGRLALEQFGGKDKSAVDLEAEARRIGNTRNDIAVGETDPYKVASQSGIAYTPAELKAIENAYAGIYDPALDTALAKVTAKQTSDAAAAKVQADKDAAAQKFEYDKALKLTPTPGSGGSGSDYLPGGTYVAGANPTVDAWAQRIFDGTAKITDIPASDKGLRNAVTVAIQASGNDLAGKPTVTALGGQAKNAADALLKKLDNRTGTGAVGKTSLFNFATIPGTDRSNFEIDFQNLKDMLSLDGVKYLKGQGAVSDAERALLASAVTKLNLAQSEDDFRSTLVGVINQLSGNGNAGGGDAGGGITVTAGGQTYSFPDQASADAFKKEAGL